MQNHTRSRKTFEMIQELVQRGKISWETAMFLNTQIIIHLYKCNVVSYF